MLVRFVILVLVIAIGCWGYQTFNPESFTKENMTEQIKKEKTINAVQQGRERRKQEVENAMNKF